MAIKGGPVCVSVINMKGGVGKTTVAAMLARYATSQRPFGSADSVKGAGIDTLAIDLDPQANLSQALMGGYRYRQFLEDKSPSIVEVFNGYQPPTPANPSPSPLDVNDAVLPIQTGYYGYGSQRQSILHILPSRFDFSDNLTGSISPDPTVLARFIANDFQDKNLVLIDCAPTESILTQAAYHASRFVLVPVKPEFFATIGFPLLNDSLNVFKRKNPQHEIEIVGVVINDTFDYQADDRTPERDRALKEIYEAANNNGWDVFENRLEYSRGFPKIMRGDFSWPGDAPQMASDFAEEFIEVMWNIVEPEFVE